MKLLRQDVSQAGTAIGRLLYFDGDAVKKTFALVLLCSLFGMVGHSAFAQSFRVPSAPSCPADASPACAMHATALTNCKGSATPTDFAACMNTAMSTANASELEKPRAEGKRQRDAANSALAAEEKVAVFSPPAAAVCPKAGVPGLIECDLASRAAAACGATKSVSDFSTCVRAYSSTKAFNCKLAANPVELDSCNKANKSRGK